MSELQAHHCMTPQQWTGLPDKNFNKKPNNAKKRPKKGQTDCSKARKKPNFICDIAIPLLQKQLNYKNIKIFSSTLWSNLAWHCAGALIFPTFHGLWNSTLWVTWCHSLHTYPSAAFCAKVSPIHSCTYDQNHKSISTSTQLSHFYREDADLFASAETVYCSQHNWHCTVQWVLAFPVITQKLNVEFSIHQILLIS